MAARETREKLFNSYAANLTTWWPELQDRFVCPICRRLFTRNDLRTDTLTLEHCIPQALGGRLLTLTCKKCNNDGGQFFDVHLKRQLEAEDFFGRRSSSKTLRGKVRLGEGEVRVDIGWTGGGQPRLDLKFDERHSVPKRYKEAVTALKQGRFRKGDLSLKLTAELGFIPEKAYVSLLRCGFLMMFRHFGYSYTLLPCADLVRQAILNPDLARIPKAAIVNTDDMPDYNTVAVLTDPVEWRCFLAPMQFRTPGGVRTKIVIMPGLQESGESIYNRLYATKGQSSPFSSFQYSVIDFDSRAIGDPEEKYAIFEIWRGLFPKTESLVQG